MAMTGQKLVGLLNISGLSVKTFQKEHLQCIP